LRGLARSHVNMLTWLRVCLRFVFRGDDDVECYDHMGKENENVRVTRTSADHDNDGDCIP